MLIFHSMQKINFYLFYRLNLVKVKKKKYYYLCKVTLCSWGIIWHLFLSKVILRCFVLKKSFLGLQSRDSLLISALRGRQRVCSISCLRHLRPFLLHQSKEYMRGEVNSEERGHEEFYKVVSYPLFCLTVHVLHACSTRVTPS